MFSIPDNHRFYYYDSKTGYLDSMSDNDKFFLLMNMYDGSVYPEFVKNDLPSMIFYRLRASPEELYVVSIMPTLGYNELLREVNSYSCKERENNV